jgi:hypothetical protein
MKKPWTSKTVWVNFIVALAAFIPGAASFFTENNVVILMTVVNVILRFVTKDKIGVK